MKMKFNRQDLYVSIVIIGVTILFTCSEHILQTYLHFNKTHGMITSFIKFALLATFGEMLGLRIRTGTYYRNDFGVLPKAIVWGFLGLTIKLAFIVFANGIPVFIEYIGFSEAMGSTSSLSLSKIVMAFCISAAMNIIYAPVMMTFHKITDLHITAHKGKTLSLLKPIDFTANFQSIDWNIQWNFVFKKTIPLFWIPAHTITFLLAPEFQVLFAALLSILLGLILAWASLKSKK